MREQQIQAKKIKELEAQGYYVIKLINTNKNGIPDLIAIPPNSDVLFVEFFKMINCIFLFLSYCLVNVILYTSLTEHPINLVV